MGARVRWSLSIIGQPTYTNLPRRLINADLGALGKPPP
jgi:hypothetical protein